ncbi:flagellar hook-length control protein FliK [Celeribacter sp.]|uniref:flagellar hook-length control protein FliK n=1 Tax=Celeribacter sp. TaxID=1890673 RepID=UPI003A915EBD
MQFNSVGTLGSNDTPVENGTGAVLPREDGSGAFGAFYLGSGERVFRDVYEPAPNQSDMSELIEQSSARVENAVSLPMRAELSSGEIIATFTSDLNVAFEKVDAVIAQGAGEVERDASDEGVAELAGAAIPAFGVRTIVATHDEPSPDVAMKIVEANEDPPLGQRAVELPRLKGQVPDGVSGGVTNMTTIPVTDDAQSERLALRGTGVPVIEGAPVTKSGAKAIAQHNVGVLQLGVLTETVAIPEMPITEVGSTGNIKGSGDKHKPIAGSLGEKAQGMMVLPLVMRSSEAPKAADMATLEDRQVGFVGAEGVAEKLEAERAQNVQNSKETVTVSQPVATNTSTKSPTVGVDVGAQSTSSRAAETGDAKTADRAFEMPKESAQAARVAPVAPTQTYGLASAVMTNARGDEPTSAELSGALGVDDVQGRFDSSAVTHPRDATAVTQTLNMQRIEVTAGIAAQIVEAVKSLPDRPVEISLSPEELGRVRLTFQVSETGAMTVVVQAEKPDTAEMMRRNIHLLQEELSALGYEQSEFQFSENTGGESHGNGSASRAFDSSAEGEVPELIRPAMNDAPVPVRVALDGSTRMDMRL